MKSQALVCLLLFVSQAVVSAESAITRIAFGSCAHQDDEQPIWQAVNEDKPELFIFLGDNVYADTQDPDEIARAYGKLGEKPGFQRLRKQSEILAVWDDHDYGENDAGKEFPIKEESRRIMLDFWGVPEDSPRRSRDSGIYTSRVYGPPGQRVQVILLDLRWNRTPLNSVSREVYQQQKAPKNMGPYEPTNGTDATLLGDAQWHWLEQQLQVPAELRLIGSSIQLLPEFTGWETWANFPHERSRLITLIDSLGTEGVVFISGDTHWSEFTRIDDIAQYPLWEATSSGLTQEWKNVSPNKHRLGSAQHQNNYGLLEINWNAAKPFVTASIKAEDGNILLQNTIALETLKKRIARGGD